MEIGEDEMTGRRISRIRELAGNGLVLFFTGFLMLLLGPALVPFGMVAVFWGQRLPLESNRILYVLIGQSFVAWAFWVVVWAIFDWSDFAMAGVGWGVIAFFVLLDLLLIASGFWGRPPESKS